MRWKYGDTLKTGSASIRGTKDPVKREEIITQMGRHKIDIMTGGVAGGRLSSRIPEARPKAQARRYEWRRTPSIVRRDVVQVQLVGVQRRELHRQRLRSRTRDLRLRSEPREGDHRRGPERDDGRARHARDHEH